MELITMIQEKNSLKYSMIPSSSQANKEKMTGQMTIRGHGRK